MFKYVLRVDFSEQIVFPQHTPKESFDEMELCKIDLFKHLLFLWHGLLPFPHSERDIDFDNLRIRNIHHFGPERMKRAQDMLERAMLAVEEDDEFKDADEDYAVSWKVMVIE